MGIYKSNQVLEFQYLIECGPRGSRTPGLLNAIETRSQLRYGPIFSLSISAACLWFAGRQVDLGGFEPPASSVRLRRAPNCATGPSHRVEGFYPMQD
jgi:hypothetical protein